MNRPSYLMEPEDVFKVCITSSRDATLALLAKVKKVTNWCIKKEYWIIVGDAEGGDDIVIAYCNLVKYERITVWGAKGFMKRGTTCGINRITYASYLKRDEIEAANCDLCVAVWNGYSKGTKYTFDFAKRLGKQVKMFNMKKDYHQSIDKFNRDGGGRTSGINEFVKPRRRA